MISVIIPARNEIYLQKTIENILENSQADDTEIIAVCDGYWPDPPVKDHPKVNIIHHSIPRGQRQSINEGARIARGNIIGKLDAHCAVGPGFDVIIERDIEPDMTLVPEMYNLDIDTWTPKYFDDYDMAVRRGKVNPYMYIGMVDGNLRAQYYNHWRDRKKAIQRKDIKIDETMCCMGPGWFIHKDRFWQQGGCDEEHGGWGQQGVEVACKAWLSGGRLMVDKNTWFAHWFRGSYEHPNGRKGFPYSISQREVNAARRHSNDIWMNDKWDKATHTFQWLLDKFNPPGWKKEDMTDDNKLGISQKRFDYFVPLYKHIHNRHSDSRWKGVPLWKFPTDMSLYHEVLWETRPDTIVEIGTAHGGSSLYLQDMLDLCGNGGKVITLDIRNRLRMKPDPRITYIIGDSRKKETADKVKSLVHGKVMVTIDGDHSRRSVKWDLHHYAPMVTKDQYLVLEDCYCDKGLWGPGEAKEWFLKNHKDFEQTDRCKRYLVGLTMTGWLKKVK